MPNITNPSPTDNDREPAARTRPNRITRMLRWRGPDLDVAMADDWYCPHCFWPLRPSAVRRNNAVTRLLCELCHAELLTIEPLEG
jgi:hypothetical protein